MIATANAHKAKYTANKVKFVLEVARGEHKGYYPGAPLKGVVPFYTRKENAAGEVELKLAGVRIKSKGRTGASVRRVLAKEARTQGYKVLN